MFRKKELISAIYHEGGFSKAAKKLHIAQPSLSVMVSNIEKEIGARIFDRSTSPVRLTEIGSKYLECCDKITMIEEDFTNFVSEINGLEIGSIDLGGNTLYMSNIMPSILFAFSGRYPAIHVRLYDHDSTNLVRLLHSGEIDIALDNLPENDPMLDKYYLGTEYLLIAVPSGDPLNNRLSDCAYSYQDIIDGKHYSTGARYLKDLYPFRGQPFIMLQKGFDTRMRTDTVFSDYGILITAAYEMNQLSSAFGMAATGLGMTVVSDTLVRNSRGWSENMTYYAVYHQAFTRDVYYYTHKSRMLSKALEQFITISRAVSPLSTNNSRRI